MKTIDDTHRFYGLIRRAVTSQCAKPTCNVLRPVLATGNTPAISFDDNLVWVSLRTRTFGPCGFRRCACC